MIKYYKQFESLLNKLEGPSKEDIYNDFIEDKISLFKLSEIYNSQGWELPSTKILLEKLFNKEIKDIPNNITDFFNMLPKYVNISSYEYKRDILDIDIEANNKVIIFVMGGQAVLLERFALLLMQLFKIDSKKLKEEVKLFFNTNFDKKIDYVTL